MGPATMSWDSQGVMEWNRHYINSLSILRDEFRTEAIYRSHTKKILANTINLGKMKRLFQSLHRKILLITFGGAIPPIKTNHGCLTAGIRSLSKMLVAFG